MKLKFLGTGPCSEIKSEEKKDSRMRSSAIVSESGVDILIDASPDFSEQARKFNIGKLDAVLFTHAHADAISGIPQLKEYLAGDSIIAVMERETFTKIKEKFKDIDFLQIRYFNPGQKFSISDIDITPFSVKHSIQPGFPTVGFKINNIVYAEDMESVGSDALKYFKEAKVIILDAAMWFGKSIKGHMNAPQALEFAKQFSPKKLVLTQAGHTYPKHSVAEAKIKDYWKEINGSAGTDVSLARDGMVISTAKILREQLAKNTEGLHLSISNAERIHSGEKKLILKAEYYKNKIGKLFYLIESNQCYGIIKLLEPKKIDMMGFEKLKQYHKINNSEKNMWWPKKQVLYVYPFEVIRLYDNPREILTNPNIHNFSDEVKFLDTEETLIKDVTRYNPLKLSTAVLKDDFRILTAWYTTKRTGGKIKHNIEIILNLATLVYRELKKRGIKFHPEKMKKYARELFDRISTSRIFNEEIDLTDPNLLNNFKDFKIIKDFISVCGSVVDNRRNHTPNDMDLVVRLNIDKSNDYIKRAVETRIIKDIKEINPGFADKLHFIWGDSEGAHSSYIPIYDLILKRIEPLKKVEMTELELGPVKYMPQKPVSPAITDIDKAVEKASNFPYYIEEKVNGFHTAITKDGDNVKIYSEEGQDMTKSFPTLVEDIKNLSNEKFAIDGELMYYKDGKPGGRADLIKFAVRRKDGTIDDSNIRLKLWDVTFFKLNLKKFPLRTRIQHLKKLKLTKRISEIKRKMVSDKDNLKSAINWAVQLPFSEGAVIKEANSQYTSGKSSSWFKFRSLTPLNVIVVDVIINKAGNYNYLVGVKAEGKDLNPDKIKDGYLVLGKTFNTNYKANKGSKIMIDVEEVWRHESDKGISYSIHKPRVGGVTKGEMSTIKDLDDVVVAIGIVVKNADEEGGEGEAYRNLPKRMIENFTAVESRKRFVIHQHTIGESVHYDIRHDVGDSLEGFTLFTTGDFPNVTDLRTTKKHMRGTIKGPQPKEWLTFSDVTKPGGVGASRSKQYGGVFTIVAKGEYEVIEARDHKIELKYYPDKGKINKSSINKAKQFGWPTRNPGDSLIDYIDNYSYHIAHIGDKHILLIDKLVGK